MDDGTVHLFASDDGALSFSKVLSRPIHDPSGDTRLHVRFVYSSGHFPVQIWFYGTIVARCGTGCSAPDVVARLVLSGDARQGATLTASDRTWGGDAPSIAFQWRRCDAFGSSCADIVGANAQTYTPVAAAAGAVLRARVTASSAGGSSSASSLAMGVVAPLPAPDCSLTATPALRERSGEARPAASPSRSRPSTASRNASG